MYTRCAQARVLLARAVLNRGDTDEELGDEELDATDGLSSHVVDACHERNGAFVRRIAKHTPYACQGSLSIAATQPLSTINNPSHTDPLSLPLFSP